MEQCTLLSPVDNLRKVVSENNPLFSFYTPEKIARIQQDYQVIDEKHFIAEFETLRESPDKLNEDRFIYHDFKDGRYFFGIPDGASSQKLVIGLQKYNIKGSAYLSHLLSFGFDFNEIDAVQNTNISALDIMTIMNSWIREKMSQVEGVDYNDVTTIPGMAASFYLLDFNKRNGSLAHVSDSVAAMRTSRKIVVQSVDQNAPFDEETMKFRLGLCEKYGCSLKNLKKIPEAAEECRQQLIDSYGRKVNKKCGVLNGMPELVENKLIHALNFDFDDVKELLLFSDGALLPYSNSDTEKSIQNFVQDNPFGQATLTRGLQRLDNDEDRVLIPRLKHNDDSTCIRIILL